MTVTLRLLLRVGRLGGFLFPARAAQDVAQPIVAFVTGELVDRSVGPNHRVGHGPGPRPRRRIVYREAVLEGVGIEAREAFDEMEVRAGAAEARLVGEVGRVDDERVALPVSARIADP